MSIEAYRKLAKHLDDLPGGFPPTASGVELRILRRLFTEEEAAFAVHLTVLPEPARVVARRAGIPTATAQKRLEEMSRKGLILRVRGGDEAQYLAAQFVVGIWEYHVEDLDEQLIRDVNEYLPALVDPETWRRAPQMRTIPVQRAIQVRHSALPYEQGEELVRRATLHLVAPCICRREHRLVGKGCDRSEESCLVFDLGAEVYRQRGIGRVIDQEEALAILARADEEGLVLQPANAQTPLNICTCCGCCCQVLLALKRFPRPADYVSSPYLTKHDPSLCTSCGACLDRCQMGALAETGGEVRLEESRCIGCGLCVSTCPTDALRLERKARAPKVPGDFRTALYELGKVRGKMSAPGMAWAVLKSKLDRLLASR